MLSFIGYFLLLVVIMLIAAYFYVESQRKKAIAEQKRAISLRIAKIKSKYKDELLALVEQQTINIPQHEVLYRVANNFFIFQSIGNKSITYCEFILNNITGALHNINPEMPHYDEVKDQVGVFVNKLPMQAREFSPNFYKTTLPKLINKLVEAKEAINDADVEISILDQEVSLDGINDVKEIIKNAVEPELKVN